MNLNFIKFTDHGHSNKGWITTFIYPSFFEVNRTDQHEIKGLSPSQKANQQDFAAHSPACQTLLRHLSSER